jgi:hypothetical protein
MATLQKSPHDKHSVELGVVNVSTGHMVAQLPVERLSLPGALSPADPLDPLNWSSFQKHTILSIVMALCV